MRIFLRAANDRLEGLQVAPGAHASLHGRALSLVLAILCTDAMAASMLLAAWRDLGNSRTLLLMFDVVVVAVDGAHTLMK
jgi:hypothetical protein